MNPNPGYTEMKAFLRFFSSRFLDQRCQSESDRPMTVLERHERESSGPAESALRMAVNNCLEISSPWPLSQVIALDTEMRATGILSLSQVRSRVWGRYTAMLKRGVIRNDDESAVAQGVLADPSLAQSLPVAERVSLQAMVRAYGQRRPTLSIDRARAGKAGRGSYFKR